jgi:hypothetical protein
MFWGVRPDLKHLEAIGTRAFAFLPAELRRQLDKKGTEGKLVGYDEHTKGYRVLLDGAHKIVVAHTVKFLKGKSPLAVQHRQASVPDTSRRLEQEFDPEPPKRSLRLTALAPGGVVSMSDTESDSREDDIVHEHDEEQQIPQEADNGEAAFESPAEDEEATSDGDTEHHEDDQADEPEEEQEQHPEADDHQGVEGAAEAAGGDDAAVQGDIDIQLAEHGAEDAL